MPNLRYQFPREGPNTETTLLNLRLTGFPVLSSVDDIQATIGSSAAPMALTLLDSTSRYTKLRAQVPRGLSVGAHTITIVTEDECGQEVEATGSFASFAGAGDTMSVTEVLPSSGVGVHFQTKSKNSSWSMPREPSKSKQSISASSSSVVTSMSIFFNKR